MRYFFDTEFIEDGRTIDLISIGIVSEHGQMFYVENMDADVELASDWVKENVMPHLDWLGHGFHHHEIGPAIKRWIDASEDNRPEFWAYYADYDWVVLCQLFGRMIDLPKGWPMFCMDIKQLCVSLGNPKLPAQATQEHHALNDAIWAKEAYEFLIAHKRAIDSGFM